MDLGNRMDSMEKGSYVTWSYMNRRVGYRDTQKVTTTISEVTTTISEVTTTTVSSRGYPRVSMNTNSEVWKNLL